MNNPPERKTATLINVDGTATEITSTTKKFSLKELQDYVGGYIERVQVVHNDKKYDMIVNEEGLLEGLEKNPVASQIAGGHIVGPVVLIRRGSW